MICCFNKLYYLWIWNCKSSYWTQPAIMPDWLKSEIKPSCIQTVWFLRNSWNTRGIILYQISYAYCNSNWLVKLNRTSLLTHEDQNYCILTDKYRLQLGTFNRKKKPFPDSWVTLLDLETCLQIISADFFTVVCRPACLPLIRRG